MTGRKQGIMYILMAAFFFALMNLFIRLAGDVPTMQKCFFRNAVAAVISASALIKSGKGFKPKEGNLKYLFLRATGGTIGLFCNFYAIDNLNISDASILNKLSPFFAMVFSVFILKETADKREWGLVALAFFGAVFVVKPSFSGESVPALIGVISGIAAGFAYTYVRKLGQRGERGPLIVFFFSAFSCIATLPNMIFNYSPMSVRQVLFLLLTGAFAAGGQFCITAAYTKAPAKEISVFDYSQVVFAAVLGMLFLNQFPDILSIIGYVIIISAAVLKWHYGLKAEK